MRKATRAQWVKFAIVTVLYLAFLIWVKSWLGLIVLPFIFDIYISKKIPWGFWKKSENPAVRSVMSWVDAIVFALVAVYFVNIYVFQNYQIPSSSLEKSLLVGDYLYVSKLSYGPRVPNTPLSMPLAQHTLPLVNTKSYIEWPQWDYKRVPGLGKVKRNDIVVFNFPAGDTVATNFQQTDFYTLAYNEGQRLYPNPVNMDSLTRKQQRTVYDLYYNAGRNLIRSNPKMYGDIVVRPVDRRENYYMKRFTAEMSDKIQDFLDADADFICVTDRAGAKLEITYKGAHASRPADVIDVDEFVGVKSHRAKGKRLTTYDVDRLRMIEPELPPEPEPSEDESLDDGQLTDASADAAQRAAAEGKASGKSALKEPLGAKPAPGKASAGQPSAGTIVGGVEFEVERPKGDAGEMIDPEQLNLF